MPRSARPARHAMPPSLCAWRRHGDKSYLIRYVKAAAELFDACVALKREYERRRTHRCRYSHKIFNEYLYPDAAAGRLFLVVVCPEASPEVARGLLEAPMAFNCLTLTPAVVEDLPTALSTLVPITWTAALDATHGISNAPTVALEVSRALVERLADSLLLLPRHK